MRTPSPLAIATFGIALGLSGCAKSEPAYETRVQTPLGDVKTECPVPLAYSRHHGLIAFGCDDGRLLISRFNSPDRLVSDVFILNAAAIEDTERGLSVHGFRPAGPDGLPASLMSIDLLANKLSVEDIDGAQDVDAIEINSTGDCLLAARSDRKRHSDYMITAHDLRARRVGDAINRTPDLAIDVTGNEASSIGHLIFGFSRCLIGPGGQPIVLLTRIQPVAGGAIYSLELHTADARPILIHQSKEHLTIPSRHADYRLALIDGETGRLGLVDLSGSTPRLTWVRFDGRWLHYDPVDGTGVVFRGTDAQGADGRGPLVFVRCDPTMIEPFCRDDQVVSQSAIEAYSTGAGGPGAGVSLSYTDVSVSPQSTHYAPRLRWLF